MPPGRIAEEQLARQCRWLGDSWKWLLTTVVLEGVPAGEGRPTALDVGCGPGLVMELLSPYLDARGVDIDAEAVKACRTRHQEAVVARAEDLPFDDGSFDIVYCSFLLLWVEDATAVLREMARVARTWVLCLAEPDYCGRISYPPEVSVIEDALVKGLRRLGADPMMGRKLPGIFAQCGLMPTAGTFAGMWAAGRMREEADREWEEIVHLTSEILGQERVIELRRAWDRAVAEGTLVQHNPVFYALSKKER
jgi:SAM-dependent methyltransferase